MNLEHLEYIDNHMALSGEFLIKTNANEYMLTVSNDRTFLTVLNTGFEISVRGFKIMIGGAGVFALPANEGEPNNTFTVNNINSLQKN